MPSEPSRVLGHHAPGARLTCLGAGLVLAALVVPVVACVFLFGALRG